MKTGKDLLAYCGFYCGDCLGYTGVIANGAKNLVDVLEKYKFNRTAECIFPEELGDYDKLFETLSFMAGLRCSGRCREGEQGSESPTCEVRDCCRDQGLYACFECDAFETCDTLRSLHKGLHAESSVRNLKAIREMGLDAWLLGGKRSCYWIEEGDGP